MQVRGRPGVKARRSMWALEFVVEARVQGMGRKSGYGLKFGVMIWAGGMAAAESWLAVPSVQNGGLSSSG